jgi:2-desacetyl-2-hydroxyethyl bacteriochlorophyllide A dehydrogenase
VRAAVLTGPGELTVRTVPPPQAQAQAQAVVRLETVGVCGTDVSIYAGKIPVDYPRVLGHELVGRVVRPGPAGRVPAGTRVLINPSIACGRCAACHGDLEQLCPNGALIGRDADGGFAELIAVDEDRLLAVPPGLPASEAALLQVLGTCVHAQQSFEAFPGQSAAVVGLGVAGFLMIQLLRARGIRTVIGVTRSAHKQRLGQQLGASVVVSPAHAEQACMDLTDGRGVDFAIEAAGTAATFAQAVRLAALGGTVVLFGTMGKGADTSGLPFYDLYYKELTVRNPRAARHRDYARAIDLAATKAVELSPLWSASFPLESAADALDAAADSSQLKVTLDLTA